MAPKDCSSPEPVNMLGCVAKGIKAGDGIIVANRLILHWGDYSVFSGQPNGNTSILKSGRGEVPLWLSRNEPDWYPQGHRFVPWPHSVG